MITQPASIELLIARVRRGDEEAFRRLLELHQRTIEATLVASGIRSRDAAFDLAQEIALKVWQRSGELREPARFPHWLRRVTANAARDHLRRQAARREESLEQAEAVPAEGTPEELAARRVDVRLMATALGGEGEQTVHLLVARAEGAEVEQLATAAGLTPAALKMRLTRARQRLRRRLAGLRGEPAE